MFVYDNEVTVYSIWSTQFNSVYLLNSESALEINCTDRYDGEETFI